MTKTQIPVIGFTGFAGVGKDEAFKAIEKHLPFVNPRRAAFADSLKQDVQGCWDALKARGHDMSTAEAKERFRDMWVWWSRVAKRFEPRIWPNRLRPIIVELRDVRRHVVVVTDVRYDYEISFLQEEFGATIFEIVRPGYGAPNDEEEREMRLIHERYPDLPKIINDVPLEDYHLRVVHACAPVLGVTVDGYACERCGVVSMAKPLVCAICGKTLCRGCIMYNAGKGKFICNECK